MNDKVTVGTVGGKGTVIVVEVYVEGMHTGIIAADIIFDIDPGVVTLDRSQGGVHGSSVFPLVYPTTETVASLGAFAAGLPPGGHIATVRFITQIDVTGKKFSIGVKSIVLAASNQNKYELSGGTLLLNTTTSNVEAPANWMVVPQ